MNKETKKFNEVIKKRKKRVIRLARAKAKAKVKQTFKWVKLPKEKKSWWRKLLEWLHIK
jgi:hypothetical protein